MSLTLSAVRMLARAHARKPIAGPILTWGRQAIIGTLAECEAAIRDAGLVPNLLPDDMARGPNVPAHQTGRMAKFTSDECMFWMLCGTRIETLDVSDYENADHVHDLNLPVPEALAGRFGMVIDGGTMEHVFDVPQAMRNMRAMVRMGGRIVHMNPLSNWAEHGYYQFSPTVYHDFYTTNGFVMRECLLLEVPAGSAEGFFNKPVPAWRWSPTRPSAAIISRHLMSIYFEAEKVEERPYHVPQQGEAAGNARSSQLGGVQGAGSFLNRLRGFALDITPAAGSLVLLGKKLLRRDLSSKPWGLEYAGRF